MKKNSKITKPRISIGQICSQLVQRFFSHDVGRDSAALAYYLLFAIFPLLIFASLVIGALDLDIDFIIGGLSQFTPADVSGVIDDYLEYVISNDSRYLLWFSLIFSIWFPMRATNCLTHSVRKAFGRMRPDDALKNQLFVFFYAVLLIIAIGFTLVLTTVGRRALEFAAHFLRLTEMFINVWTYLRFVLLFFVMAFAIGILYMLALGERRPVAEVTPGVITSLALWMGLSIGFAYYVEHMAHYTELYGSIATVIVVLLWLFMSAMSLILGAEVSGILSAWRAEHRADGEEVAK